MSILSVSCIADRIGLAAVVCVCIMIGACASAESKTSAAKPANSPPNSASIPIETGGPADTVRKFYSLLRDKKFREAIFLTNLRPAVEGLTDAELGEFSIDLEAISGQVPARIEINGEIISGDEATVTANLPNEDGDKNELQKIRLRRENGVWVILSADNETEKTIRRDGRNYFYNLRISTHEDEARRMLERISKAELAYSLQNGGKFADIATLVAAGLLPNDVKTSDSTGYDYAVNLLDAGEKYFATAMPAVYGKTGRLSFILQRDAKGVSHVASHDTGGKMISR